MDSESSGEEAQARLRKCELAKYDETYFLRDYWAEDLGEGPGNRGLTYHDPNHTERFSLFADLLKEHFDFKSCLDAGCGLGGLVSALLHRGINAQGCEVASYAVANCQQHGLDVERASLTQLPYGDKQFDLVVCSDVLEHLIVFDICDAARELTRVTRQDLVLTINLDNPYKYHPTILSRETWRTVFLRSGKLAHDARIEQVLHDATRVRRPEYEWFCFRREEQD